jgi:hypothetical protein
MQPKGKEIDIKVMLGGAVRIEFSGYVGDGCMTDATNILLELAKLGIEADETSFMPKPELEQVVDEETETETQRQREVN